MRVESVRMKASKTEEEREMRVESKLSFVRKFFPDSNMMNGSTGNLRRRGGNTNTDTRTELVTTKTSEYRRGEFAKLS